MLCVISGLSKNNPLRTCQGNTNQRNKCGGAKRGRGDYLAKVMTWDDLKVSINIYPYGGCPEKVYINIAHSLRIGEEKAAIKDQCELENKS